MSTKSRSLLSIEATAATLEKLVNALSNHQKYTIMTAIDISLFLISIGLAIGFEYGLGFVPEEMLRLGDFTIAQIGIEIGLFWYFGIYQQVLRYIDGGFIFTIAKAVFASSAATIALSGLFVEPVIPIAIPLVNGMLVLILSIAFRLCVRLT